MALSEREILDRMKSELKSAACEADLIASHPKSGLAFGRLRASLKNAEGCCRQLAVFREDSRWLIPGVTLEKAHQIARAWLHRPSVKSKKLFTGLAAALRQMYVDLEKLETARVGRTGAILPSAVDPKRRGSAPMPFHGLKTPGGIYLPSGLSSRGLAV